MAESVKKPFFLLLLVLAALFLWLGVKLPGQKEGFVRATVKVDEGTVDLYRVAADGSRHYLHPVHSGETAEVTTSKRVHGSGGPFRFASPLFWKVMTSLVAQIDASTKNAADPQFTRFYTQEQFRRFIADGLETIPSLSDIRLELRHDGWIVHAHLNLDSVDADIHGKGVIGVDGQERFYLRLERAACGPVPLPSFVLRQLEDVFYNSTHMQNYPLRVLNMEYRDGGILITCRRQTDVVK